MNDMPNFDAVLMGFVDRLREAEFSADEISEAAAALGEFTGEAFNIIQKHIGDMIDRFGLATVEKYAGQATTDEWYRGFISGIGMALNAALYGDEYIKQLMDFDAIPKIRSGMGALFGDDPGSLSPEVLALMDMLKEGHEPSEDVVRAAMKAWIGL